VQLLLRELQKNTPPDHPESERLAQALDKVQAVAAHVNEAKRYAENMSKLLEMQHRIVGDYDSLVKSDRRFLREGRVGKGAVVRSRSHRRSFSQGARARALAVSDSMLRAVKQRQLFLFNDMLLWTTTSGKFRGSIALHGAVIAEPSVRAAAPGILFARELTRSRPRRR
jgi:hypothetical protein